MKISSALSKSRNLLLLCVSVFAITACGGGGSSNGGESSVARSSAMASSASQATSSMANSSSSIEASSISQNSSSSVSQASSSAGPVACMTPAEDGNGGVAAMPGFYVEEGKLYDVNGNEFVMRGVNYPYAWFRTQHDTAEKLADIASTCANTVRVVLANGEQWNRITGEEVSNIIAAAKANHLITLLEVHDATGYGDEYAPNAAEPMTAVDYWLSEDIRAAIDGEEGYVLINIANEPLGNFATAQQDRDEWIALHTAAIEALRNAGLMHTLMVDAPNWGQDWRNIMRDGTAAQTIFDSDINKNLVFSVHMYQVYNTAQKVEDYLQAFVDKKLPLIVGEFAADHGIGTENDVAEAAILQKAQEKGMGYLGWSWSGNSSGLSSLDIVENFDVNNLSAWGETLINSEYGIRATSNKCSCYVPPSVE